MATNLKRIVLDNAGLKASALVLAVLVWAILSGRERAFSERTLKIPVEVAHVSENVEVVTLRPEEVSVSLKGASRLLETLSGDRHPLRIDLQGIRSGSKLNYFAEDYLALPAGLQLLAVHPKMIEVIVEEFVTREIPVKVSLRGRLPQPLRLKSLRAVPERVTVIGYKSRLEDVIAAHTEAIDLAAIRSSQTVRVLLRQTPDILKFRDQRDVEVQIDLENAGPGR